MNTLNRDCFCVGLDDAKLSTALAPAELDAMVRERCPHAFAARPVFVGGAELERMAAVVAAVESVVALPAYREAVLADAPAIARVGPMHTRSVFFGYDFHLDAGRLGLIEVNTNAGGALLNVAAARAQRGCCAPVQRLLPLPHTAESFEQDIVAMFRAEWRLARGDTTLRRIAIVDEAPSSQYLYPEFLLFQRLFERHGIQAVVCDPSELRFEQGRLWHAGEAIDLVYNRLTDFALETPASAALREAYLAQAVVLTPHPQAHALYADKRNLVLLGDDVTLQGFGVPAETRELLLQTVPRTRIVRREDADALWQQRRQLFFKPWAGFGGRAAYRGDKLTRKVWDEILASGHYIAQQIVVPGERLVDTGGERRPLKFDLRNYAYDGQVQWVAARLYEGQTTNFRTPGGGFAPVYRAPQPCGDERCATASD
ncbi:hypothetical protein [Methylibium petroleiphilum]|uniref:hypothetical protein n=1 Tax=Methylibium petroleiphilum TaxID=105560 RepID=UPI001ACA7016|nr:hypothetical protein [Methylibium petroleiphilum]MBN9206195.1 hypothetical protein [Methylibium petroleiphilum]